MKLGLVKADHSTLVTIDLVFNEPVRRLRCIPRTAHGIEAPFLIAKTTLFVVEFVKSRDPAVIPHK